MNTVVPSEGPDMTDAALSVPLSDTLMERRTDFQMEKKKPKRVLHFCDGTLEEYSTDEDDDIEPKIEKHNQSQVAAVNPATLTWMPWFFYQTMFVGNKALAACDFLGEYLAGFFGIISPKYEYEIEHYKRMLAEEKEKKKEDIEFGGWEKQSSGIISEQFRSAERSSPFHRCSRWTHNIEKSCQV